MNVNEIIVFFCDDTAVHEIFSIEKRHWITYRYIADMSDDLACCFSGKVVRNISVNKRPERPYGISNHSNIYGKSGDFK